MVLGRHILLDMYAPITTDITHAVRIIQQGRVVAFPSGTSYGLAVDALQGHALQRLRNLKQRQADKTFSILLKNQLWDTYFAMTDEEKNMLKKYDGKALTLLVRPKGLLDHLAQDGKVGLRVVDHPLLHAFVEALDVPITSTSANVSGQDPCYTTACVVKTFPGKIDPATPGYERAGDTTYDLSLGCILDGGNLEPERISTVAQIDHGKIHIIRKGVLELEK